MLSYWQEMLMSEITLTIQHKVGLHARPAAQFVQTAKQFKSDIRVITVYAEGEDADQALEALESLVADDFGEAG